MCLKEILKHFCCSKNNNPNDNPNETDKKKKSDISIKELLNHINDDPSNEIFIEKEEKNSHICKLDFRNSSIYKRRTSKASKETSLQN